jgi:hypothetical protein
MEVRMKHPTWGLLGVLGVCLLVAPAKAGDRPTAATAADESVTVDAASSHAVSDASTGNVELDRILKGFKIAPVPLDTKGKDKNLVGLGSYIVNAQGACNDCHTEHPYADGGDPYLGQPKQVNPEGYLAGGQAFGPFITRNLTPRGNGLPEGYTFAQFKEVLRTGHDLKHVPPEDLLQVMPWPIYGDMTDHDLRAIYEYLRSIPSLPSGPGAP